MNEDTSSTFDAGMDPVDVLSELRLRLSQVYHDANNPLAIISGNAQFLLELARAMDLDDDLIQPMTDIEEASERVAESLRGLTRVRDGLKTYLDGVGSVQRQ